MGSNVDGKVYPAERASGRSITSRVASLMAVQCTVSRLAPPAPCLPLALFRLARDGSGSGGGGGGGGVVCVPAVRPCAGCCQASCADLPTGTALRTARPCVDGDDETRRETEREARGWGKGKVGAAHCIHLGDASWPSPVDVMCRGSCHLPCTVTVTTQTTCRR